MASNNFPGFGFDRRGEKVAFGIVHESVGGENWLAQNWNDYFISTAKTDNPGSYHYLILLNGFILEIVPETLASASTGFGVVKGWNSWNPNTKPPRPDRNLNWGSINVCLVTPVEVGGNYKYPANQLDMLDKLCRSIQYRYPAIRWLSHDECDTEAVRQGMPAGQAHHDPRSFSMTEFRKKLAAAPPPTPPAKPVEYVLGFADYAKAHPEIGQPVESEFYGTSGGKSVSIQRTTNGILTYDAKQGVRYAKWQ